MTRPKTKQQLLDTAEHNFTALFSTIESLSDKALTTEFDFSHQANKKEAHWSRDKNLRDVLVHLFEWHQLLLHWIESNMADNPSPFLPPPYNWKTYGEMNQAIWCKHQRTQTDDARQWLINSHQAVITVIKQFSDEQLFSKHVFPWTGTTTLGSYCISATSSQYDWAIKKLKAHSKNLR